MPDEFFNRPVAAPRRGSASLRALIGMTLLAFVGGALLVGYLVWNGQIALDGNAPAATPAARLAARPASGSSEAAALGALDQRIAALDARLSQIDQQAGTAAGNAARAENLLVAFAARRAIERGAPLGPLADQLKQRFGASQPGAVQVLVEASGRPVTLDQLIQQLDALAPALSGTPADESVWDRFSREVGSLFVVRHGEVASARPEDRLDRVKLLLRTGQVGAAADEVARMPGSAAANAWIANARRFGAVTHALDLIETAALAQPAQPQAQPKAVPAPAATLPEPVPPTGPDQQSSPQ